MTTATITRTLARDHPGVQPGRNKERVHDDKIPGFYLEVSPSGRRTYWLRYTDPFRRRRDFKIGRHGDITADQARKRAQEMKANVSLGGDPAGDRDHRRDVLTFATYASERFMPHVRETVRSHAEYETMARLRLIPILGRLGLDEITVNHVATFRRDLVAEGLSNARVNRHLAVLRRAMNLALRWELYVGRNPAQSPGMLREEPRELFLEGVQVRALMKALTADPDQAAASAVALLALTGARKSEVLNARWECLDLDRGILTVPLSKSGRRRHVMLSDPAVAVLRFQPHAPGQPFIFPSTRRPGHPIEGLRAVWARAKEAAALPPETRLHDLRHTFASLCVNDGVPLYEVSKLLGHTKQATTTRYAHLRNDRLLAVANAVGCIATGENSGA